MILKAKTITTLALGALLSAGAAQALQISSNAEVSGFFTTESDPQGPQSTGTVFSTASHINSNNANNSGLMVAQSSMNDVGVSAVLVSGRYQIGKASASADASGQVPLSADVEAVWSDQATNTQAEDRSFVLSFQIDPLSISIVDDEGSSNTDPVPPTGTFCVEVLVDGVLALQSVATLTGGTQGHTLVETGLDLVGTLSTDENLVAYDFLGATGAVPLGTVAPGQSVTVEYRMKALFSTLGNAGVEVSVGDPLDLNDDPGAFALIQDDGPVAVDAVPWSTVKSLFR